MQTIQTTVIHNSRRRVEVEEPKGTICVYCVYNKNPRSSTFMAEKNRYTFSTNRDVENAKSKGVQGISCHSCRTQHKIEDVEAGPMSILLSDSSMHECYGDEKYEPAGETVTQC